MTSPSALPEPADHFLTALEHEVRAHLSDNATNKETISLKNGERVRVGDENTPHEYMFFCERWKDSFDSDRLLARPSRSRDPWEYVTVTVQPKKRVLVTTDTDFGDHPGNFRLREDETRSLLSLADRIHDCGQDPGPVNPTTAGWLLGEGDPPLGTLAEPHRHISGYRDMLLNDEQRTAIEHSLGSGITFIWGPPGTGKTEVVSLIAEGSHRLGERVLFLAPTRVAVDQALERICERLEGDEDFDSGLVQRAGEIEVASLRERFGSMIDPEMIAGRLGAELSEQAAELEESLRVANEQRDAHEDLAQAQDELSKARAQERKTAAQASHHEYSLARARTDLDQVSGSIRAIGSPSGIFAGRKAERLARLLEERDRLRSDLDRSLCERDAVVELLERLAPTIREYSRELDQALEATMGLPSAAAVEELIGRDESELARVREELDGLLAMVRSRCRVLGTTLAKALRSHSLMEDVDTVIIDEAGMVDLPSAWCAAGLAGKRVVVAGDFRQLPAITQASGSRVLKAEEKQHSRLWMDRDAFHAAGLVDSSGRVIDDPRLVALGIQYRMRPHICEVVNLVAYRDAPLVTGREKDVSRLPYSPLLERSVVLVDTTDSRVRVEGRTRHKSNHVHEAVIHELVRGLQYDEVLPGRKHDDSVAPSQSMAVISPYRDQVTHLDKSLKYRFGKAYEGLADTVHRFQGSQRPLVILDTVAGEGKEPGYFYEGTGMSSTTARLLNVALSRAQDHLVVVADVGYLREHLRADSETVMMLDLLERIAQRIPAQELVPVRSAGDLAGLSEEELRRPAFFPADEVYKALEWDLEHATESVEIYCAFLNKPPVQRWLKYLSGCVSRGVKVTVFTRPVDGNRGENADRHRALMSLLQEKGCDVRPRERMHEKVVILDGRVLWHGSLNLLAVGGPTDLMMRLTDPDSCDRVRRIVERARRDQPLVRVPEVGEIVDGRLYLNVPFEEKDDVKRLGNAKWHPYPLKMWSVASGTPRERLTRWL
ncbi:AAA domain-containing protein [Nocardiopsis sp. JB363]|uniref:AAA domain-containing protein n=1 Tax=Nocardiopsis sp. JB363 TaxID=1434837 RepID=UPI00097A744F|nr:AAA domain-containing protein [Nocardiopsis sp. JB363]SIO90756.1 DNA helicase [Nocardiopsis sp. JB363]